MLRRSALDWLARCLVLGALGPLSACSSDDSGSADGDGATGGSGSGAASGGGAASGTGATNGTGGGTSASGGAGSGGGLSGSGGSGSTDPRAACKRGLAYGEHSKADFAVTSPGIAWWYNWATQPDEALKDGSYRDAKVEYVPMIWGKDFDVAAATQQIPQDAEALLGFNEPNFGEQSNMPAVEAAALWPKVEQVADAKGGLFLVSPAVNFCGGNCQDTDPFKYLTEFFEACDGCRVDAVAFHIYVGCHPAGDNKAEWLINHVETYKQKFNQPLWLTEFACDDAANMDEQIAFLEDAVQYLENEPRIQRYAWFSGRFANIPHVNLLGADGELTSLGLAYVQAPTHPDCQLSN